MSTNFVNLLQGLREFIFRYIYDTFAVFPVGIYHLISCLLEHAIHSPLYLAAALEHAYQHPLFWFGFLFIFRYLRLIVHCIAFRAYEPTPIPEEPTLTAQDCTIIIPTVDPSNIEFTECLQSVLLNRPKRIIIVTVGMDAHYATKQLIRPYKDTCPDTDIMLLSSQKANKRTQVAIGIAKVKTKISVLVDDHVLWGRNFLPTALAPFEDEKIGAVGTKKRVRKQSTGFNLLSYWNMLGALYLERHNFEIRATNTIDGGVFVISGRTSLHRTEILQHKDFVPGFTNERFFFGLFGPLNADDDNYITRFEVSHGWKIKIQYSDDACIETTLGAYPRFTSQCLRWVRTTWRSNSASLFTDRTVWRRQPWCVYAVYITSFFNFALFNDAGLAYLLWSSGFGTPISYTALGIWIFATKMVKLWPYFQRHPEDLRMLPGYFAFAYSHSLIKLYAMLTFWDCHWGGRDLNAINTKAAGQGKITTPTSSTGTTPVRGSAASSTNTTPSKSMSSPATSTNTTPEKPRVMATTGEGKFVPVVKSAAMSSVTGLGTVAAAMGTTAATYLGLHLEVEDPSSQVSPITKQDPKTPTRKPASQIAPEASSPLKTTGVRFPGFPPFNPPANIEDYHLHGPPPGLPVVPSQSSRSAAIIPSSSEAATTPCKHCSRHRFEAVGLMSVWALTLWIHYLIYTMNCAPTTTHGNIPRDWARANPGGFVTANSVYGVQGGGATGGFQKVVVVKT